jgi:hypothetical protein
LNAEFRVTVIGNVQSCRTEAEVYLSADADAPFALVYESRSGWMVDVLDGTLGYSLTLLVDALAAARAKLEQFVNRRGENPPAGLTNPGLSLWLLKRTDGTAMGRPI